jgi:hypothetical protein
MLSRKAVSDLTVALSGTFAERVTPENAYEALTTKVAPRREYLPPLCRQGCE